MTVIKVLFVCSGNKRSGISPIVSNQGESLRLLGVSVEYFPINGKGLFGYLSHYWALVQQTRKGNYNAIHAHYSLCGFLVSIAQPGNKNVIVSLMGSFYSGSLKYLLIHFFSRNFWKAVIVKSEKMYDQINLKTAHLIPNGVQVALYEEGMLLGRDKIRKQLGFEIRKKYVVFLSDPARPEKNFDLCKEAVDSLNDPNVELVTIYDRGRSEVIQYQLAADVLMLTSLTEGSPNVIKEAMVAGCPIVSTDVGDVKRIIGDTEGCYVLDSYDPEEAVIKLRAALSFNRRTNGLSRIKELGLDAQSVGERIISLYKQGF